jgi:16S rRNA (cytosine967-C5)-methyltransferase
MVEEICQRLGIKIVKTVKADAAASLPVPNGFVFDRVLADVPCSGFGTLRKNPDLKWRRGEKDIRRLSELQLSILGNLSAYVKEGGVLVYSTCTVFHEENEDVVERFLDKHPEFELDRMDQVLPEKCHFLIHDRYFKTFSPKGGMDGFFAARLIKSG